ncbi:hypothetical protein EDC17_10202 [Sphingobacterium alimentarium]|uniref:Uncharacterized protein n=1 Tax=Sphingobacterium alimentarium TaxID=797292 RepID=A0A4R3VXD4_9SPHI|nr:hypothetical protein EDC17_10202 [Sphingobacterium alimentarium]
MLGELNEISNWKSKFWRIAVIKYIDNQNFIILVIYNPWKVS